MKGTLMKIYFIRHGATAGNREGRYVGRTDEGILEEEREQLRRKSHDFPAMNRVFVSPYLRCRQTAELVFGKNRTEIMEDFREMDFGEFEYKNYQELSGNPEYQKFIDSGGAIGFPGGEEPERFKCRCREAFRKCVRRAWENGWEHVGLAIHGGTIMAILEAFACPPRGYYEYQAGNGCGFICRCRYQEDECSSAEASLPGKSDRTGNNFGADSPGEGCGIRELETITLMIEEEIT